MQRLRWLALGVLAAAAAGCTPQRTQTADTVRSSGEIVAGQAPAGGKDRVALTGKSVVQGMMGMVADEAGGAAASRIVPPLAAPGGLATDQGGDAIDQVQGAVVHLTRILFDDLEGQSCAVTDSEVIDAEYEGAALHAELTGVSVCASLDGAMAYAIDHVDVTVQYDDGRTCHLEIDDLYVEVHPDVSLAIVLSQAHISAEHPGHGSMSGTMSQMSYQAAYADGVLTVAATIEDTTLIASSGEGSIESTMHGLAKSVEAREGSLHAMVAVASAATHGQKPDGTDITAELTGLAADARLQGDSVSFSYSIERIHIYGQGADGESLDVTVDSLVIVSCPEPNCMIEEPAA